MLQRSRKPILPNLLTAIARLSLPIMLTACTADRDLAADSGPNQLFDSTEKLIQRAALLELNTPYVPPPGDPDSLFAVGFARTLCSAIFVSGLDEQFAAENVGFFTAPYEKRHIVVDTLVDEDAKTVTITTNSQFVRAARFIGDFGCVPLPEGEDHPYYEPPVIQSRLPDPVSTPWPLGDRLVPQSALDEIDESAMAEGLNLLFSTDAMTAAIIVTHKGHIVAERYSSGIDFQTPLESWSMGKSLTATLLGVVIEQGGYVLEQAAPIPEWQIAGDPRQQIKIQDILRMSSGLRCYSPYDPEVDPTQAYFDHHYLYTGTVNSFHYAATRPLQWPPNTVGRYRNCEPVLANYLVRLAVERRGDDYHQFPQRHLFDKLGIQNMVLQTDPYGNLLLQGSNLGTARDWARLGNLYLNNGMAHGERLLPEGFVDFVRQVAPAWEDDGRPVHGGFFWLEGASFGVSPGEVYSMLGAGGQMTTIVPSKELVIVRLGHFGGVEGWNSLRAKGLSKMIDAVPVSQPLIQ